MLVGNLPLSAFENRVAGDGLILDFGAAVARIRSRLPGLVLLLQQMYRDFPVVSGPVIPDATVTLDGVGGLRRFVRRQVEFVVDGIRPFDPFPADTHLPLLEWGLNYTFAQRLNQHLLLHSGALATCDDRAVLMPGMPGAGKSTLTAALMTRGYRLLSDEFGVIGLDDGLVRPLVRPVALKNESIEVIRRFSPASFIGPDFPKTRKGTVAHLAPSAGSVEGVHRSAVPVLLAFPSFHAGAPLQIEDLPPSQAMARLGVHSFNYKLLGVRGFDAVARLVDVVRSVQFTYGSLQEGVEAMGRLLDARQTATSPTGSPKGAVPC